MILSTGAIVKDGANKEYILDELIGKGGFGYVFKAHRVEDNEVFAVKTMHLAFSDEANIKFFKNEIDSAQSIDGEGVIKYIYTHDGDTNPKFPPYIIMEYAEGGTLRELLDSRKKRCEYFSSEEIIGIFRQLAIGMKSINNTLIHRDIKPENILICGDQMKITDFGLAKLAIESTRTFTFKGAGTPLYMAPEAWDYSKNTIQMDMYSMGLVFYEIATLNYAYAKMPASYEEAKDMHMYTTIRRPSLVNGDLNPTIDSIICRMTEKRALKRFTNWDELIEAMEKQENRENSFLDKIADRAVASKNTDYIKRTEAENEERRKKKQQENFIKSVRKQFETEILQLIEQYVDKVNQSYAGQDKMRIKYTSDSRFQSTAINCIIESGNGKRVDLDFKIVLENSFQRDVYGNDLWSNQRTVRTERYTPCYCKKTIMLMGEIYNTRNLGYNLLLLKSDDIFGDWILMKNFNNLSFGTPGKERREPFPFSLNELPEEIVKVQSTHLYRSEFVKYDEEEFISIINRLISM